ncbi:uncharacterized protein PSFLO_00901 [Pseudozyma flocculosa]|nr:uncharacterized protein PSFLO_00901 [Pseudozyma flocculosa]
MSASHHAHAQHFRSDNTDGYSSPTTSNPDIHTPRIHPTSSITSSLFNSPIDPLSAETSPSLNPAVDVGRIPHHPLPHPQQRHTGAVAADHPIAVAQSKASAPAPAPAPAVRSATGTATATAIPLNLRRDTMTPLRQQQQQQQPAQQQQQQQPPLPQTGHNTGPGEILVISGGSGYNDLVSATPGATYVMPVSDNGGSSSEIIRVLGGPSIGDLRSRLNRLIPIPSRPHPTPFPYPEAYVPPPSNAALHALLSYRLPSTGSSRAIKQEWHDILEGRHPLWRGIESDRKEVIRGFLVHFESEVLRRAHRNFNFRGASIGNFFLAAAQKFFRSIQSAIFLFSATTQIDAAQCGSKVVPVINTNHTATIAAQLEDGEVVVGQCEISHPAVKAAPSSAATSRRSRRTVDGGATKASTLEPGTPSSAIFEPFDRRGPVDLHDALARIATTTTPSGRSHLSESVSAADLESEVELVGQEADRPEDHQLGTSYDSMSGSLVLPPSSSSTAPMSRETSKFGSSMHTPASLAYRHRGRTTVGNTGDGLDPDDDDDHSDGEGAGYRDASRATGRGGDGTEEEDDDDDDGLGGSGNIVFSKDGGSVDGGEAQLLSAPIERIFYVNAYRNEIYPAPNPTFLSSLDQSRTLIYSCGSLWTSLIPCLILRGVGTHIATSSTLRYKILLLNTIHDRETHNLSACDFISAITASLNRIDVPGQETRWKPSQFVSHLVYFQEGQIHIDTKALQQQGIACVKVHPSAWMDNGRPKFDEKAIRYALDVITASGQDRADGT